MIELDVTWPRLLQIWWALFWRWWLYALLPAIFIGLAVGAIASLSKLAAATTSWIIQVTGVGVGFFSGIWAMKTILNKTFTRFRIALIALPEPESRDSHPNTPPTGESWG